MRKWALQLIAPPSTAPPSPNEPNPPVSLPTPTPTAPATANIPANNDMAAPSIPRVVESLGLAKIDADSQTQTNENVI